MWRSAAVFLLLAGVAHAEAPREKLTTTLSTLKETKQSEAQLKAKLADTQREVKGLREDATELAADVQAAESRVSREERRYRDADAQLQTRQRDFDQRKKQYAQTLASLTRVEKMPATAMIANPKQGRELLRTAKVMQEVNEALAARAEALQAEMVKLEKARSTAQQSKQRLAKETASLSGKQKQLNRELARRQDAQKTLSSDLAAAQTRVASLSKQSASLQDLIGKLEADRNRASIAKRGESKPLSPTPGPGNWKTPVSGDLTHRYGERKNSNETYRGLVWRSRGGAAVVSPASGEVVFTGPFRDYGRMVLVKHGNDRISLLAGMGNIAVTLNQSVGRGEPLGSMSGGSPTLYYELRQGSKPIDPTGWFANLGSKIAKR